MKTAQEIREGLYDLADRFRIKMKNKKYAEAKHIYDTALTVATYIELDETIKTELFGSRHTEPATEGLFREQDVQRAVYECSIKRKTEEKAVMDDLIRRYGQ